MSPQHVARTPWCSNHLATVAHWEHTTPSNRSPQRSVNTGLREWLRKITSIPDGAALRAGDQLKLAQAKKLVCDLLGNQVSGMSPRDLRVYMRIVHASEMTSVREVRFECFDLMCRKLSELVAVRHMQQLDILIA